MACTLLALNCEVGCSNVFVYSGVEMPKHWSIVLLVFNLSNVLTTCILQTPPTSNLWQIMLWGPPDLCFFVNINILTVSVAIGGYKPNFH